MFKVFSDAKKYVHRVYMSDSIRVMWATKPEQQHLASQSINQISIAPISPAKHDMTAKSVFNNKIEETVL